MEKQCHIIHCYTIIHYLFNTSIEQIRPIYLFAVLNTFVLRPMFRISAHILNNYICLHLKITQILSEQMSWPTTDDDRSIVTLTASTEQE